MCNTLSVTLPIKTRSIPLASVGGHYHQVMLFGCLQDDRNRMLRDNHSAGANPLGFCFCRYSAQDLPGLGLILVHLLL